MLPVLAYGDWQVETVFVDLGTGMREWIEVRGGGQTRHCADTTQLQQLLLRYGLNLSSFIEVDTIDDGCE